MTDRTVVRPSAIPVTAVVAWEAEPMPHQHVHSGDVAGSRPGCHARPDVDRNAPDLLAIKLYLPGVQPNSDLEA